MSFRFFLSLRRPLQPNERLRHPGLLAPEHDHSAVTFIHIQSDTLAQKKGPGFWKFNSALLKDEYYIAALRENIPNFREKYSDITNLGLKWDLFKMEIRGFTVKYSKQKAKVNKDKEKSLQEKINTLQAQTEKHPHNKKLLLELNAEKMRLKRIMNKKLEKLKIGRLIINYPL